MVIFGPLSSLILIFPAGGRVDGKKFVAGFNQRVKVLDCTNFMGVPIRNVFRFYPVMWE